MSSLPTITIQLITQQSMIIHPHALNPSAANGKPSHSVSASASSAPSESGSVVSVDRCPPQILHLRHGFINIHPLDFRYLICLSLAFHHQYRWLPRPRPAPYVKCCAPSSSVDTTTRTTVRVWATSSACWTLLKGARLDGKLTPSLLPFHVFIILSIQYPNVIVMLSHHLTIPHHRHSPLTTTTPSLVLGVGRCFPHSLISISIFSSSYQHPCQNIARSGGAPTASPIPSHPTPLPHPRNCITTLHIRFFGQRVDLFSLKDNDIRTSTSFIYTWICCTSYTYMR